MPINPVRDSPYSMREGTDILNTRHAAPVLRYVLRNDGCILQDLRDNVAGNCETILAVCARLTEAGLLTYEDVRSRPDTGKRSTRYSLTPKGRDVALLYEAMSSVIAEDGRIDPGLLDGFLEEAFRGRFRGMERSHRHRRWNEPERGPPRKRRLSRASRPGKDIHWTAFWTCSKISSIPPTPGMTVRTPLSP